MRFELTTFCLGSKHSTTELRPHCVVDDKSRGLLCQRHWLNAVGVSLAQLMKSPGKKGADGIEKHGIPAIENAVHRFGDRGGCGGGSAGGLVVECKFKFTEGVTQQAGHVHL